MSIQTYANPSSEPRDTEALRERIQLLLELSLFRQALAEVHRYAYSEADPESLRQLGVVIHRFAPRSQDRGGTYSFARALYRTAATQTQDPALNAEILFD